MMLILKGLTSENKINFFRLNNVFFLQIKKKAIWLKPFLKRDLVENINSLGIDYQEIDLLKMFKYVLFLTIWSAEAV